MMATGAEFDVVEVGYFGAGQFIPSEDGLSAGMVGYLTASIKMSRIPASAIRLQMQPIRVQNRFPVIKRLIRWCTVDCIRQTVRSILICGMRWKSCS